LALPVSISAVSTGCASAGPLIVMPIARDSIPVTLAAFPNIVSSPTKSRPRPEMDKRLGNPITSADPFQ
jgi:hypothetical protein